MMNTLPSPTRIAGSNPAIEIALVIFWSSGFIGAVIASRSEASVFLILFWRFSIAGLLLIPFMAAAFRTGGDTRSTLLEFGFQAFVGVLAMAGFIGFVTKAIDLGVPAGTTALITALQPMATAALAGALLAERVRPVQWFGLLIGLFGVGLAVRGSLGTAPLYAYAFPFVSTLCVVAATILSKGSPASIPLPAIVGIQSIATALVMVPLALVDDPLMPLAENAFWTAIAWFILLSTFGAYGFYWLCLARSSATRVASLIYLTPPVTALWAWAMFGQPLSWWIAAGFAVCLTGVWIARDRSGTDRRTISNG